MKDTLVFLHPHFLKRGGATKVVLEQASRLIEKKINCLIVTTKIDRNITNSYPQIKFIELSKLSTGNLWFWFTFPIFFYKLISQLNQIPNKILYCHSISIYWGYLYKLFYKNTKIILYFHDLGFPYFDSNLEINSLPTIPKLIAKLINPIFNIINTNITKSADYLISNSQTTQQFIIDNYHRTPDTTITPGYDSNIFKPSTSKKDYVITVGRLEKIKNIKTIIDGFILYKNQNPLSKTKLIIAGDGIDRQELQNSTLDNSIEFIGTQTPLQLSKLYSQAKLGIFMSPSESFGLAALECLASGTPVIGVNQNGIKEIISNFNQEYLVNNDSHDLSLAIEKLINKKLDPHNSVTQYSWDNQINNLSQWLNTLK